MKFVITEKHRYWWPVIVRIPDPNEPGKIVEQKLKLLFEPQNRAEALAATEVYNTLKTAREQADHEHHQLLEVVKNWDDVEGEDKNPIAFSPEVFLQALNQSCFRTAVYNAYAQSLNGAEARVGN